MKTKNSLMLMLAITVLIPTAVFAQTNIGIRHGVAATTLSDKGDLYNDNEVTFSYTTGLFSTFTLNKSLSLQPELNYNRKGRSNETTELNTAVETDFMLHYLQIPVLLQYRNDQLLNKSGSVFYIHGGPYAAFVLNTQTRVSKNEEGGILVPVIGQQKHRLGRNLGDWLPDTNPSEGCAFRPQVRYGIIRNRITTCRIPYKSIKPYSWYLIIIFSWLSLVRMEKRIRNGSLFCISRLKRIDISGNPKCNQHICNAHFASKKRLLQ